MGTLSHAGGKPFGYRGVVDTCRWCGDRLRPEDPGGAGGYRDNGFFCSLRCGFQWAVRTAHAARLPAQNPVTVRDTSAERVR